MRGNGRRRLLVVDRHPHQLAAGPRQRRHLPHRAGDVGRVGVGHRLHHDRVARADGDTTDARGDGRATDGGGHGREYNFVHAKPRREGARRAAITGVATYVPERVVTNADLARTLDTSDEWIVTRTGIRERRRAAPGETTSDDGCGGGATADGRRKGLGPDDVDALIVATVTPDMVFPATACLIQDRLGLRADLGLRPLGRVLRVSLRAHDAGRSSSRRGRTDA